MSQSKRCREILKKLSLNPNIEDNFLNLNLSISDYVFEIVKSYQEISKKKFNVNIKDNKKSININKSIEIIYGLRNFIGNANKFSRNKVDIIIKSDNNFTSIIIRDDGPGFPKDLIDKQKLGEPYIRTVDQENISKYGLGLGTFIGKTLLEKNFANVKFNNLIKTDGAEVQINWKNNDLKSI